MDWAAHNRKLLLVGLGGGEFETDRQAALASAGGPHQLPPRCVLARWKGAGRFLRPLMEVLLSRPGRLKRPFGGWGTNFVKYTCSRGHFPSHAACPSHDRKAS